MYKIVTLIFAVLIIAACSKKKTTVETGFEPSVYVGLSGGSTTDPFGTPENGGIHLDSMEVFYEDGYILIYGNKMHLSDLEYGEDYGYGGSSGYWSVCFLEEGDSIKYSVFHNFGPSGAGSSYFFNGRKIE